MSEPVRVEVDRSPLRCPFCHEAVLAEKWVACAACLARHHDACFDETGRCSVCGGASIFEPMLARAISTPAERAAAKVAKKREIRRILAYFAIGAIFDAILGLTFGYEPRFWIAAPLLVGAALGIVVAAFAALFALAGILIGGAKLVALVRGRDRAARAEPERRAEADSELVLRKLSDERARARD